jgi:glycosidase
MRRPRLGWLPASVFLYPYLVMKRVFPRPALWLLLLCGSIVPASAGQSAAAPAAEAVAPTVSKVEPPAWWVNLTPGLMVLVSGRGLEATKVACNLPDAVVEHTQATQGGDYLFVWLKFGPRLRSGTIVCRITTAGGEASFELPVAKRQPTARRFHGLDSGDVLYLILPDRFANGDPSNDEPAEFAGSHDRSKPRAWHGGDLRGVRDHLPYLKELGATALWLTPVVKNGATSDYHGYGAVDLYALDPHLGGLEDYRQLANALHERRMKLLFDAVPNHVGPGHPWVRKPPLPDWFHGSAQNHLDSRSPVKPSFYGNSAPGSLANDAFEALTDPHATPRMRKNTTEGWFFGVLPDLNTENPVVAQYLLQNSIWWIESAGLDGLRLDTFPYVSRAFWEKWHAGLRRIYPNLTTVGEVFHPDPVVTSFFAGGRKGWDGVDTGLSTVFDFPLFFALREVLLRGAPAGRIAEVLRLDALYPHPEWLVPFFANHDVTRFATEAVGSQAKLLCAFALVSTLRGIPEFYYGDEIGMPGGADPDNRRDFPGGWAGDPQNAFAEAGRSPEQQLAYSALRDLLQLRREHPALRTGTLSHLFSDEGAYVFLRQSEDERLVVVFNNEAKARTLVIPQADTPLERILRASRLYGSASADSDGKQLRVDAPPQTVSVFSVY